MKRSITGTQRIYRKPSLPCSDSSTAIQCMLWDWHNFTSHRTLMSHANQEISKEKVRASEVERKESSLYFLCRCVLKVYSVKQKFDYNDPKPIGFRFLGYFSCLYQSFYPQIFRLYVELAESAARQIIIES